MKSLCAYILFAVSVFTSACDQPVHADAQKKAVQKKIERDTAASVLSPVSLPPAPAPSFPIVMSPLEMKMKKAGLIDIATVDTSIIVDLKYSTANNFIGVDVYGDYDKCYLLPDVAEKLKCSQEILRSRFPFYRIVVFDAVRPRSIQAKMWDTINVPYNERSKYVSNPANGSLHNFGAAVDVSIRDVHGIELDMGTPYDYFGELAYPREEERMLEEGKLTHIQFLNRELLRDVMEQGGFMGITTEWWHFNSCYRSEAYEMYKIIE
ncbi:MAG: M15 family metallopeptidase [Bacteroidia bacterium]